MTYKNFVRIIDISTVNPLWATGGIGQEVLILAKDFNLASGNIISPKPKSFQETDLSTEDKASSGDTEYVAGVSTASYIKNFDRRKSNVSYAGFDNHKITVTALYNPTTIGANGEINNLDRKIFTPAKLMELVLKPRTMYIKDELLWGILSNPEDNNTPAIYGKYGIPVILTDWSITPSLEGEEITMNLTFTEDKGDTTRVDGL